MSLDHIRKDIDTLDSSIRDLIMKRLDCSSRVIHSKIEDGNYVIYRADREAAMIARLGEGIPDDRKDGYLALVRKIIETSRMYQYGILYDEMGQLFAPLIAGLSIPNDCSTVRLVLSRPDIPNGISPILSMIGDYGYTLSDIRILERSDAAVEGGSQETDTVIKWELAVRGNLNEEKMRKLMLQLSFESTDFHIIEAV